MISDAAELVKLIKACRKAKLESLKFGELELKFQAGDAAKLKGPKVEPEKPPTEEELKRSSSEAVEVIEQDLISDQLATLQIEDPEEYERLLIQRELEFGHEASEAVND